MRSVSDGMLRLDQSRALASGYAVPMSALGRAEPVEVLARLPNGRVRIRFVRAPGFAELSYVVGPECLIGGQVFG